jgi:DNA-binding XRE family transcriptional regulator
VTDDLHPDDRAHIEAVVAEIHGHRRRLNLTVADCAERVGLNRNSIRAAESEANRRTGTVQQYAYAVGMRIVFVLDGLPHVDDPHAATLERTARQATDWRRRHGFERAALGAQLGAVRRHLGRTQKEMLVATGRGGSFISDLEQHTADDVLLASYQRYTRALGGMLHLRVLPGGSTDEVRLRALLDELGEHALVAAVRYRAVTPHGAVKGVSLRDAQLAVAEHGGQVEHAEVWLLPTKHEVLGPWLPYEEKEVAA